MPFKKGAEWNGNRAGRKVPGCRGRCEQFKGLETWARVLRMRDELVVERKQVGVDKDGNPIGERFQLQFGPVSFDLAVSRDLAPESCPHYPGNGDGLSYN
jgi:hypothetical protein